STSDDQNVHFRLHADELLCRCIVAFVQSNPFDPYVPFSINQPLMLFQNQQMISPSRFKLQQ
ncbi:hypothetical protein, partial [Acinetobacter nosocomialis]|uniref:hypothetical protein n=1 Tax=Acinetobacter nosocomialis TaxID=106654 RepID=UPI001C06E4D5